MVTRTIKSTECEVLCLNTETAEACNVSITLGGVFDSDKDIMKAIKKGIKNSAIVLDKGVEPVKVVHTEVKEALYGMPEEKFIANAEILPARETKAE